MGRGKTEIFASLAALALSVGAFVTIQPAAGAATPECGAACRTLASEQWGFSDVVSRINIPHINDTYMSLDPPSETPNEDFYQDYAGTVLQFYQAGYMSAQWAQLYPNYPVYEFQYAPDGDSSGSCIASAATAGEGTGIDLATCGSTSQELWIPLPNDQQNGYDPMANGSSASPSAPYVMTGATGSAPGVINVVTDQLTESGGVFNPAQMWVLVGGVL